MEVWSYLRIHKNNNTIDVGLIRKGDDDEEDADPITVTVNYGNIRHPK